MHGFHTRLFLRDRRGSVSILAALSVAMLLGFAAIAIDSGSLYFAKRDLQAATDAAALAAVQNIPSASATAADMLSRNGYSPTLTVSPGVYAADESLSVSGRFTPGAAGPNAVRIRSVIQKRLYFGRFFGLGPTMAVAATATAARLPSTSFGAGTAVARLDAGLINALLGQLWNSSVSLSLADYQALLDTNIDALTFFDSLATHVGISGSYQQLAGASVTTGQLLAALIDVAQAPGATGNPTGALLALKSLQLQLGAMPPVTLSNIVSLSPLAGRRIGNIVAAAGSGISLNLMSLLSAQARTVAAGRLINLGTAISVPVTNSGVTTRMAIGQQMPQLADARIGDNIQTAQIRLALVPTIANVNLVVATAAVRVPIFVEMASGRAVLSSMPCNSSVMTRIAAQSGLGRIAFGTVSDAAMTNFAVPVTPVAAPVVAISLLGIPIEVNIGGGLTLAATGPSNLDFSRADIASHTIKSVPGSAPAPFTLLSTNFTLSTNILGNAGILAATLNGLLSTLVSTLNPVVANLIGLLNTPVDSLLAALGLRLGVIDVQVFDSSCRVPVLVG